MRKNLFGVLNCVTAYLVHSQVDASIRDDAQHVWNVALVERCKAFSLENMLGAVWDTQVLAGFPQSKASF